MHTEVTTMSRREESIRVSLRLSKEAKARLDNLKERTDADSLTEVIRHAIALYEGLLEQDEKGEEIILRNKDGNERLVQLIY